MLSHGHQLSCSVSDESSGVSLEAEATGDQMKHAVTLKNNTLFFWL